MVFPAQIIAQRFGKLSQALQEAPQSQPIPSADPKLAQIWVKTQLRNQAPNTLYVAAGFGPHLLALYDALDPSCCLVIYEADLSVLKTLLSQDNYKTLLADTRVQLFAGSVGAGDYARLHELPIPRITDIAPLRYMPAWNRDAQAYSAFLLDFTRQFNVARRLHLTNYTDSIFWQANSLVNIKAHHQSPDIAVLKDCFKGIPVVLVGAGPSLDEAEEFLKKADGHALIITGNSSYRKLVNIGVHPQFVLAADPRLSTFESLKSITPAAQTSLVAPFIVAPNIPPMFEGHSFSWGGGQNILISTLRRRLGLDSGTPLVEKGTISISIADFAKILGSRSIILVGQDMAGSADGKLHTDDSFYADQGINRLKFTQERTDEILTEVVKMVPGNTLPEVPSPDTFQIYIKLFEEWVENNPDMGIINTAKLGAKIGNVDYVDYQAASQYLLKDRFDPYPVIQQALQNAPEHSIDCAAWYESLEQTHRYAKELFEKAVECALRIEMLPQKMFQPTYKTNKAITEIYEIGERVNQLISQSADDDYKVLLDGYLKKTVVEHQRTSAQIEADNPHAQSLLRDKSFFWAVAEGVEPFLGVLSQVLKDNASK